MTEEQQFSAILNHLANLGHEVSGREACDSDLDDQLQMLADGLLRDERTQNGLLAEISGNATAISRLAEYLLDSK